jgi:hypothetical protein
LEIPARFRRVKWMVQSPIMAGRAACAKLSSTYLS